MCIRDRGTGEPKAESFVSIEVKDPKGVVSQLQTDMNGAAEFTPEMAGTYTVSYTHLIPQQKRGVLLEHQYSQSGSDLLDVRG